jgi:hypothetical protein
MGLFSSESHTCNCKGTWDWPHFRNSRKHPHLTGEFLEKDSSGIIRPVKLSCDDQSIYLETTSGVQALDLTLTLMEDRLYYSGDNSNYGPM